MQFVTAACRSGILWVACFSFLSGAEAHHSLSAYDSSTVLSVTGTVSEYEWRNPHIQIHLRVRRADSSADALFFEGANIGYAERLGWSADSFREGETITASYNPFLNGKLGGHLVEIATAEGEVYSLVRFRDRGVQSPTGSDAQR
nr:MAG: hypothetical protein E4H34_00235 [Hyphomicrobiales bacterium]